MVWLTPCSRSLTGQWLPRTGAVHLPSFSFSKSQPSFFPKPLLFALWAEWGFHLSSYRGPWAEKEGQGGSRQLHPGLASAPQGPRATGWDLGLAVLTLSDGHTGKWLPICGFLVCR